MITRLAGDTARVLGCAWLTLLGCLAVSPAQTQTSEARVAVPVASVYASPSESAERVTQALLWDRVLVLRESGKWVRVLVPDQYRTPEGYPGWMLSDQLASGLQPPERTVTVVAPKVEVRSLPDAKAPVVQVAYLASDLPVVGTHPGWYRVALPGGEGWVRETVVVEGSLPPLGEEVVRTAERLKGVSYLWGGMCRLGIDCSGLVYVVYKLHGFILPRDADQQYQVGTPVEKRDLRAGDLVFFGSGPERITHVGIFVDEGRFLDASGRKGVAYSQLVDDRVVDAYVGARRILPEESGALR